MVDWAIHPHPKWHETIQTPKIQTHLENHWLPIQTNSSRNPLIVIPYYWYERVEKEVHFGQNKSK